MSLKVRMFASFGLILLLVLAIATIASLSMRDIRKAMVQVTERAAPIVSTGERLSGLLWQASTQAHGGLSEQDMDTSEARRQFLEQLHARYQETEERMRSLAVGEENLLALLDQAQTKSKAFFDQADAAFAAHHAQLQARAARVANAEKFQNLADRLARFFDLVFSSWGKELEESQDMALYLNVKAGMELQSTLARATLLARLYLEAQDEDSLRTIKGEFAESIRLLEEGLAAILSMTPDATAKQRIQRLADLEKQMVEAAIAPGGLFSSHERYLESRVAAYERAKEMEAYNMEVAATLNEIGKQAKGISDNAEARAGEILSDATMYIVGITAISLLLSAGVALWLIRSVTGPIRETVAAAEQVTKGNLDISLPAKGSDETAALQRAILTMVGRLRENMEQATLRGEQAEAQARLAEKALQDAEQAVKISDAANAAMRNAAGTLDTVVRETSTAARDISRELESLAHGADEQQDRVREAVAVVDEMRSSMSAVAQSAGAASEDAQRTRDKATEGAKIVNNAVQAIGEVNNVSNALRENMDELSQGMGAIVEIMHVISDIADQTNLLALNAAIEAARAGESGRGFAVVADEVRKLAEKTMNATGDVAKVVDSIRDQVARSNSNMAEASSAVDRATEMAAGSGEALREIVELAASTTQQVQTIATASEAQAESSISIAGTMSDVDQIAATAAENVQHARISIGALVHQTEKLESLVAELEG